MERYETNTPRTRRIADTQLILAHLMEQNPEPVIERPVQLNGQWDVK